jgi:ribosome-binding protein aMBF1 (putative translation factor)
MRHERGMEALDLHPIIKCQVETRLAWQLSVSDIAARMGSSYFTLKRYERGAEFPSGKMLLKWVDVLGFELVLRHKKSAASATERHKPSYRSVNPFGCPTITYVQLSR